MRWRSPATAGAPPRAGRGRRGASPPGATVHHALRVADPAGGRIRVPPRKEGAVPCRRTNGRATAGRGRRLPAAVRTRVLQREEGLGFLPSSNPGATRHEVAGTIGVGKAPEAATHARMDAGPGDRTPPPDPHLLPRSTPIAKRKEAAPVPAAAANPGATAEGSVARCSCRGNNPGATAGGRSAGSCRGTNPGATAGGSQAEAAPSSATRSATRRSSPWSRQRHPPRLMPRAAPAPRPATCGPAPPLCS